MTFCQTAVITASVQYMYCGFILFYCQELLKPEKKIMVRKGSFLLVFCRKAVHINFTRKIFKIKVELENSLKYKLYMRNVFKKNNITYILIYYT